MSVEGQGRRAPRRPGARGPYAPGAFGSVCQRPISFPSVVLADREPAHARHGQCVVGVAAEFLDPRCPGVDVVDVEVRARPASALSSPKIAPPVVSENRVMWYSVGDPSILLELPAEEAVSRSPWPGRVAGRDFDVNHLACHTLSFHSVRGTSLRVSHHYDEQTGRWSTSHRSLRHGGEPMEPAGLEPATSCMPCSRRGE